jgi:hypothetical protein
MAVLDLQRRLSGPANASGVATTAPEQLRFL